jgi:N-methylhydantoinase B
MTRDRRAAAATTHGEPNPATVEVIRNYFNSAAREMMRTLVRTAYNTTIYEMLDFGISLYDENLDLVAEAPGLTLFLGANDYGVKKAIDYVEAENMNEGDILLMNYPYWSSAHTLDPCLITPIFHEEQRVGYAVVRAHWMDMGAKDAAYVHDSTELYQEGLVFPGTKIYENDEPDEEMLELLRFNTRMSEKVIGDLNAQISALRVGRRRYRELYNRYDRSTISAAVDRIVQHGADKARAGVQDLPDGAWRAEDYLDDDGVSDDLVRMAVEVTVDGDQFVVDFSDSSDQVEGPVNLPYGKTETMGKLVLKTLTTPEQHTNAGHYEPLSVIAPEGNLFHATPPAPTFTQWPAHTGIMMIYEALSKGMPERVPASSGSDLGAAMFWGERPDRGEAFMMGCNEGVGWGGSVDHDGVNGVMNITESNVRNTPVEVMEANTPLRIERVELRTDSGGAGRHRGGLGIRKDYRLTHDANALATVKKTKTDNWGIDGGRPGARNAVVLRPGTDEEVSTGTFRDSFHAGEMLSNRTAGGGGYGDPYERSPEAVREDVLDGYVSREAARETYGVVVTSDGCIDHSATRDIREE